MKERSFSFPEDCSSRNAPRKVNLITCGEVTSLYFFEEKNYETPDCVLTKFTWWFTHTKVHFPSKVIKSSIKIQVFPTKRLFYCKTSWVLVSLITQSNNLLNNSSNMMQASQCDAIILPLLFRKWTFYFAPGGHPLPLIG